jgi:hypothetical protein
MHPHALLEVPQRCLDPKSVDRMGVLVSVDRQLDLEATARERLETRLLDGKRPFHGPCPHDCRPTEDPRHLLPGAVDDAEIGEAAFGRRRHLRVDADGDEFLCPGGIDRDRAAITELIDGRCLGLVQADGGEDRDEQAKAG